MSAGYIIAALATVVIGVVVKALQEEKKRRMLKSMEKMYISPDNKK